jgi:hypothetical protein
MTWKRLLTNGVVENTPWATIACTRRDRGYPQIKVAISPAVAAWLGVKCGMMVDVLIGGGDHEGWIRLTKGSDGYVLTDINQSRGALAIKFSGRHIGVRGSHKKTYLTGDKVVCDQNGTAPHVSIELPRWALNGGENESND